jgi:hypothetical protein
MFYVYSEQHVFAKHPIRVLDGEPMGKRHFDGTGLNPED